MADACSQVSHLVLLPPQIDFCLTRSLSLNTVLINLIGLALISYCQITDILNIVFFCFFFLCCELWFLPHPESLGFLVVFHTVNLLLTVLLWFPFPLGASETLSQ